MPHADSEFRAQRQEELLSEQHCLHFESSEDSKKTTSDGTQAASPLDHQNSSPAAGNHLFQALGIGKRFLRESGFRLRSAAARMGGLTSRAFKLARRLSGNTLASPLLCIAFVLLGGCAAGLLLDRPLSQDVTFNIECAELQTPYKWRIGLDTASSIELRDFRGTLDRIADLTISNLDQPQQSVKADHIDMDRSDDTRSGDAPLFTVSVASEGGRGPGSLTICPSATLRSAGRAVGAPLQLTSTGESAVLIEGEALSITNGYRLKVSMTPSSPSIASPKKLSLLAKNSTELVSASFKSRSTGSEATVTFATKGGSFEIRPENNLRNTSLVVGRCRSAKVVLHGKEADALSASSDASLTLDFLRSSDLTVKVGDSGLSVAGSGTIKSFKARGVEQLPTVLDELLKKENGLRGVWGVLGVIVILGAGIFVKRAFEMLARSLMPGPSSDEP
jgi:hypothetical protein